MTTARKGPITGYYVYLHSRPNGGVFYVGKGKGRRAWSHRHRSERWKRTVAKHGLDVFVVASDLTESQAFNLEKSLISMYGRDCLVNMTDGGDGISGWRHPIAVREKMSALRLGKKHSEETKRKIRDAHAGRPSPLRGRVLSDEHRAAVGRGVSGAANGRYDRTVYRFTHEEHGVVVSTKGELGKRFSLHHSSLNRLVNGKVTHVQGWTVENCAD